GNTSGDIVVAGQTAQNVRGIGLIGGGLDPMQSKEVVGLKDDNRVQLAQRAAAYLRLEDERRIREIRDIVIASVNNQPVRVDDVVEGGRLLSSYEPVGVKGVVVSHQTRLGKFGVSRPRRDAQGRPVLDRSGRAIWDEEED